MCCSIFVLAGFEVAFRAWPPLIQDLDVMHTKELEQGADRVHWSLPALLFFFLICLHPQPTVVCSDSATSQKMEGDALLKCCPAHSSLIKRLFRFIFHHFISQLIQIASAGHASGKTGCSFRKSNCFGQLYWQVNFFSVVNHPVPRADAPWHW